MTSTAQIDWLDDFDKAREQTNGGLMLVAFHSPQ